ncbi:MAG: DUF4830 domain-containing protein [Bacillota bacterium]|nr:DUF4830 domain-containing protein [Bacillota bacterium]
MFVLSLRLPKFRKDEDSKSKNIKPKTRMQKIITTLFIVLIVLVLLMFCLKITGNAGVKSTAVTASERHYSLKAPDDAARVSFLNKFGWKVSSKPTEITTVKIPEEFNKVYENYNKIQQQQGLDLSKYKGIEITRYTYKVLNYPGEPDTVNANLLVYKGCVIGGDISSVRLDGFIQGFEKTSKPE